ncbi:MAG TPA: molybdopterin cofactor-binding domain-containing protein, partial [Burkholderiaceae bacterium]|nr:molybdopterin cofactor-binding domain-containing protein [Burkholderiaceae bacterium]
MRFEAYAHGRDHDAVTTDRRGFLKVMAASGGAFAVGWWPALAADNNAASANAKPIAPAAFVSIARDGRVEIRVNRLEFGQGTLTSLPMLLAEELDVPLSRVKAVLAPAGEAYKDPVFGMQMTGGSTAIAHGWSQYRAIGATMRTMFINAAASFWRTSAANIGTQAGYCVWGGQRVSYATLTQLAREQQIPKRIEFKDPARYSIVGKPQRRFDGAASTDGSKQFGIDMKLDGQVTALVAHPPTFGGRVAKFDATKALAIAGVLGVYEVPVDRRGTGLAVFAKGYWPAKQGRDALEVEWKPGASANVSSAALSAEFRKHALDPRRTVRDWPDGVSREAFAQAAKRIVAEYEFPYLAHAPMEPLNCLIDLQKDKCTVWVGSQFQTMDQRAVADVVGLDVEQVTLNTMPAGGGFGRRAVPSSDYVREAAEVAKVWNKRGKGGPVKLIWSREDDITGGYYRPMHIHRAEIALDARGRVLAWDHAIVGQSIVTDTPFEKFLVKNGADATMTEGVAENHYDMPLRLRITHPDVPVPVLWWRSVGHTHTAYVMETLIDEIARAANQDPV